MELHTLAEAEQALAAYVPRVRVLLGKGLTLERMRPLMQRIGNPQTRLKIIHVAGTSGKTSTAYYIASLLQQTGQKVGLTVSPHVDSITERLQINLKPLSGNSFAKNLEEFLGLIKDHSPEPTYFELLIAFAYWYFAKTLVDYAVIETGLGGLHDATNVAKNPDKICVITDIGHDHTKVLGRTLKQISLQKAGIIFPLNPVFIYKQTPTIDEVFDKYVRQQKAKLYRLIQVQEYTWIGSKKSLDELPNYQQRNWLLAQAVSRFVQARDNLGHLTEKHLAKTMHTQIPARMEVRTLSNKTIVMDGAHNNQKMKTFVASYRAKYGPQKSAVLLSLKQDKTYKTVLPILLPISSHLIITAFQSRQDLPTKPIDPADIAKSAMAFGFNDVTIEPDYRLAYQKLIERPENMLIITGSFYLLSDTRKLMLKA